MPTIDLNWPFSVPERRARLVQKREHSPCTNITRLWPWTCPYTRVEFVDTLVCSKWFYPRFPGFSPLTKTENGVMPFSNLNFTWVKNAVYNQWEFSLRRTLNWIPFLSSTAQDGDDRKGLELEKNLPRFWLWYISKIEQNILIWITFPDSVVLAERNLTTFESGTKFCFSTRY